MSTNCCFVPRSLNAQNTGRISLVNDMPDKRTGPTPHWRLRPTAHHSAQNKHTRRSCCNGRCSWLHGKSVRASSKRQRDIQVWTYGRSRLNNPEKKSQTVHAYSSQTGGTVNKWQLTTLTHLALIQASTSFLGKSRPTPLCYEYQRQNFNLWFFLLQFFF